MFNFDFFALNNMALTVKHDKNIFKILKNFKALDEELERDVIQAWFNFLRYLTQAAACFKNTVPEVIYCINYFSNF